MRKYRMIYGLIGVALFFISCEKEITIDFHSIKPVYVVEGDLTPDKVSVRISTTQDVMDTETQEAISKATVQILSSDGTTWVLEAQADGTYGAKAPFQGNVGWTYELQVGVDQEEYTAKSHLHRLMEMQVPFFTWSTINDKIQFLYLSILWQDVSYEENYYYYQVYRKGEMYAWNVRDDEGEDGKVIRADLFCMSSQSSDNEDDKVVYDGDEFTIRLSSIDKKAYDYLRSLQVVQRNGGKPNAMYQNFDQEASILGYFSAYSWKEKKVTYVEK